MFKLPDPNATWKVPVVVSVPANSTEPEKHDFTAHFRWLESPALNKLIAAGDDLAFLKAVLAGYDGIDDHSGEALTFNDDNLAILTGISYFAKAVVETYIDWHQGLPIKN